MKRSVRLFWMLCGFWLWTLACSRISPGASSPMRMASPTEPTALWRSTPSPTWPSPYCRWLTWIPDEPTPMLNLAAWRWAPLWKAGRMWRHLPDLPLPLFPQARSPEGRWLQTVAVFASISSPSELFRSHPAIGIWVDMEGSNHRWIEKPEESWMLSPATFAFPQPGDRRLQALRFLDLINTIAPPEQVRPPIAEGPEPSPTPPGPLTLVEGRIVWMDPAIRMPSVLTPPVPLQGIYPLGGSLALALDTRGKLWRGDLRFARWETVELSQETPGAMRQLIGVRAGAYALVLETVDFATYRVWRVSARQGEPAALLASFEVAARGTGSRVPTQRLDETDLWILGWPMEQPFQSDAVLLDAAGGRILGPWDLGIPEGNQPWVLRIIPSPDGSWLWVAQDPIPLMESIQDPERWGALVAVTDLNRGVRLQGFTLGGWLPTISTAWLWENATGVLYLLRLSSLERIPLTGVVPPVAEVPGGGVAVNQADPAQIVRWDAEGRIQELLDLKPEYAAVIGLWSDGTVVFATVIRRESDGSCRFGLVEIPAP